MTRNRRTAGDGLVLALGVACWAGCQQVSRPARPPAPPLGLAEVGAKITPAQAADVKIALARAAERKGDVDEAIAAYRDALTRDKHRADAYWRLAVLHDRRGLFHESARLYEKALDLDPNNPEIHCDRGYGFYLQRRWAEAEQSLRKAIALRADHRRAHVNLGLVLARDARPAEALKEFCLGGCDASAVHSNLAFALALDGKWAEAREQYRLALAAKPASEADRTRLRELDSIITVAERRGAPRDGGVVPAAATVAAPRREDTRHETRDTRHETRDTRGPAPVKRPSRAPLPPPRVVK